MSAAFTRGPWQAFPSVSKEQPAVIDTAIGVDSTNGTIIAEVTRGKQFDANARLIAAAPELYEALLLMKHSYTIGTPQFENGDAGTAHKLADAAIAKVRGDA